MKEPPKSPKKKEEKLFPFSESKIEKFLIKKTVYPRLFHKLYFDTIKFPYLSYIPPGELY
jgi:hypothetical protein